MQTKRLKLGLFVTAVAVSGCAALICERATVVVAEKGEWMRLEPRFRGLRVDELGRVVESYQDVLVREHWVRAPSGHWYRVSEADWRGAEVGQRLEVCR